MTNIGLRHHLGTNKNHYIWYDNGDGYVATHLNPYKFDIRGRPSEESFSSNNWTKIGFTTLTRWEDDQEV